jgi:stearoyl-CoA desaturase (Delta-9 desaturase)
MRLLTGGEGNHNYHHTFPSDYSHGREFKDMDITAAVIWGLERLGLVWGLVKVDQKVIQAQSKYTNIMITKSFIYQD